ncbi:MAG: EAL domain-containing protein [Phycisphaeraceae bacterium]|nr:EAL domain-containing protein [Phycisphaeraceae bacterium]
MHRILVIDDNQAIHGDFRKILAAEQSGNEALANAKAALFGVAAGPKEQRGRFAVDSALQGQAGWDKLKEAVQAGSPYSVAFVDMRMPPGWDGLQTIQHLWEIDSQLQVVICTAFSDHSWEEISSTLGLTDRLLILKKPFDPIEVSQLAAALSEKWSLQRQASLKHEELERLVELRTRDLTHAATHDKLTGLPNRGMLKEHLARVVQQRRNNTALHYAVFFLDFDRFKIVNDSLGHDAGDQLLIEISRRLGECMKGPIYSLRCSETMAARLGGDEFVVVASGLKDLGDLPQLASGLLEKLAEPYCLKGYNVVSTASIGVTTSDLDYAQEDEVIRDADTAMYHAKAAGKARYVTFDRAMHEDMIRRLSMENELRGVAKRGELVVHYQPIVSLASGMLTGFEALVRWNHPKRGLLSPGEFIACAEETGLIAPIGLWVLEEACKQLQHWKQRLPAAANVVMSVNVSAKQLASTQFADHVETIVKKYDLQPDSLALEMTETAVVKDPEFTTTLIQRLRAFGVRIYMDDFGTGYSSLSHLHRLPLNAIKMDRSFMKSMEERRDYAAVVNAIVALADNLGVAIIAEGVESSGQATMLQAMDCRYAQGHLFGHPCAAEQAEAFFQMHVMGKAA